MSFLGVGVYCIEALNTILTKKDYCSQGILLFLFIKNKKYLCIGMLCLPVCLYIMHMSGV